MAGRALLVGALLEDPLLDQPGEPGGEHVAGDPEVLLDLVEAPAAVEDVADDEQGPALAEHLEGAGDRADLVVLAVQHMCDCRTLSCVKQLTVLRSVSSSNRSEEARMRLTPIDIQPLTSLEIPITEEEILADLLYPAEAVPARAARVTAADVALDFAARSPEITRSRLVTWQDPLRDGRGRRRAGRDRLHARRRRRRAPAAADRGAPADGRRSRSRRGASPSRASPARSTTTRSEPSTAATRRRCSTRRSAAPCTPRSPAGAGLLDPDPGGEVRARDHPRHRPGPLRGRGPLPRPSPGDRRGASVRLRDAASCSPTAPGPA